MTYKILSLDGGGTWALIQVKALQAIYGDVNGHAVLSHFDMAVANSGGSITLGGLLEDKPLSTILSYFMDDDLRRAIFQPTSSFVDAILSNLLGFGPKYSAQKKLPALQRLLPITGGKPMTTVAQGIAGTGSGKVLHILITGFDYDRNTAAFFRSAKTNDEWGDGAASNDVTLAQAIHASSNAPVLFFDAPATWDNGTTRFWDGAISGCNNPVLAGVTEAITLGASPGDIRALSLGTATVRRPGPPSETPGPFLAPRAQQTFPNDVAKLAGSITDDPPDVASFITHVVTGGLIPGLGSSRIVRMNPMISPVPDGTGGWKAPANWTSEQLNYLADIDLAALNSVDIAYIADYAEAWLGDKAPNQPIRMDEQLNLELGQPTYSRALSAWKAINEGAP